MAIEHFSGVQAVIHCGDLCAPFMVKRLGEGLAGIPIHVVWGNNDGDQFTIAKVASDYEHVRLHGQVAHLELEGVRVAVSHYPEIAGDLADSGNYELVCYGHDHTAHQEWRDDCLLLNPGELMGMNGHSTIAIVEIPTMEVELVEL